MVEDQPHQLPFMEHPSGEFATAAEAIASAVSRLKELADWEDWIVFSAQGEGSRPDSYQFYEVRLLGNLLDVGAAELDVPALTQAASIQSPVVRRSDGSYDLGPLQARQVAGFIDAIFRIHHNFVLSRRTEAITPLAPSGRLREPGCAA